MRVDDIVDRCLGSRCYRPGVDTAAVLRLFTADLRRCWTGLAAVRPGRGTCLTRTGERPGLPVALSLVGEEWQLCDTDTAVREDRPWLAGGPCPAVGDTPASADGVVYHLAASATPAAAGPAWANGPYRTGWPRVPTGTGSPFIRRTAGNPVAVSRASGQALCGRAWGRLRGHLGTWLREAPTRW